MSTLREQFEEWLRKWFPGIPEGCTDDPEGDTDLAWQAFQAGYAAGRAEDDRFDAFMRKRFADVVPNLCSGSWEDIWERVRDKFKEGKPRNCAKCGGTGTTQRWTGEHVECDACNGRGL